jgi:integrase
LRRFSSTATEIGLLETEVRKTLNLAQALAAPTDCIPAQLTFGELVRAAAIATCTDLDARLRKWSDAFGQTSAWDVTSEQLERAAEAMIEAGYRPATVNRDLSAMGTAYRFAKAKRLAPKGFRSPTLGVTRYDEGVRRVTISRDELEALRRRSLGFSDPRFAIYVHLLLDTGARKGELLDRRWSEFDLARREILAPTTKNGMPRVLFFSQRSADLIERRCPRRPDDVLVFEGKTPGQPISYRRSWEILTSDIGRPDLHQHDVRHAAAVALLRGGVTLPVAAQVLGHDQAVLARRYGHLETEDLRAAQERAWTQHA